jgi:hypothetical protein
LPPASSTSHEAGAEAQGAGRGDHYPELPRRDANTQDAAGGARQVWNAWRRSRKAGWVVIPPKPARDDR